MNVDLFRKIQAALRREPTRAGMRDWIVPAENECHTAGCIAGWALLLHTVGEDDPVKIRAKRNAVFRQAFHTDFFVRGAEVLDIPLSHAKILFLASRWPLHFQERREVIEEHTPEFVDLMCDVIDAYIADPQAFVDWLARENTTHDGYTCLL